MQPLFDWRAFDQAPVMGILRGVDLKQSLRLAGCFFAAGFSTLEVSLNTNDALQQIAALRSEFPEKNIGAGTVTRIHELESCIKAGAGFAVTPIFSEAILSEAIKTDFSVFCGAYTATEIFMAYERGAKLVKLFPAGAHGLAYMKEIRGPLPHIPLLPTGGIALKDVANYISAGARGVALGSALFGESMQALTDAELLAQFGELHHEVNRAQH